MKVAKKTINNLYTESYGIMDIIIIITAHRGIINNRMLSLIDHLVHEEKTRVLNFLIERKTT